MSPNPQWAFVHQCSISMWSPYLQRTKVKIILTVVETDERELLARCTNTLWTICVLVSINDAFHGRPQDAINLLLGNHPTIQNFHLRYEVLHFLYYTGKAEES